MTGLNIGGIIPFSTTDYPGHLSTVLFTQGCNFRCFYCYNYYLVEKKEKRIPLEDIKNFLLFRKDFVDSVVISGGEPTIHKNLPSFCAWLKKMEFLVKLDTNGSNPSMIKLLITNGIVDFIAMDIKAPWNKYSSVIGLDFDVSLVQQSLEIIKQSGVPHEFITTVHSSLHTEEDIIEIAHVASPSPYVIHVCKPTPRYKKKNMFTKEYLLDLIKRKDLTAEVR